MCQLADPMNQVRLLIEQNNPPTPTTTAMNKLYRSNFWHSVEPNPKKMRLSKECEPVEFGMDLVVFDKHQRCSLKEGQYEFVLSEMDKRTNNDKCTRISTSYSSWEDLGEDKEVNT